MSVTAARNLACKLALSDPRKSLALAREVSDPWYRCQALSYVGRYWPGDKFDRILNEAVDSANSQANVYKKVAVAAWPARAFLERGSSKPATRIITQQLLNAPHIENQGGRSEALLILFEAARPFEMAMWQPIFEALVQAAEPALSWRQLRALRDAFAMTIGDHPALSQNALNRIRDERNRKALTKVVEGDVVINRVPRAFFHL